MNSDASGELGYGGGLNLGRLSANTTPLTSNSMAANGTAGSANNGTTGADAPSNMEIFHRINALLENSLDLSNMSAEPVAPKRHYSGNCRYSSKKKKKIQDFLKKFFCLSFSILKKKLF